MKWSKEQIINQIQRLNKRGEPLNPGYLIKNHISLYKAMGRYFGEGKLKEGWEEALKTAGLKPKEHRLRKSRKR